MARYRESVCRFCRREGLKLYLKGERCYTDKCGVDRRNKPPGQHGDRRVKYSDYGLQLREKQKVKRIYGLLERQFSLYFEKADRMKGVTGYNLILLLERRLDNVVYRLGFACSRNQARQLVRHGHISVNGRKVNVPSYQVSIGEKIEVLEGKIRYFDSKVDYSRITISIYSRKAKFIDLSGIGKGFGNAIKYAIHFFFIIIWFIIIIIPLIVMILILRPVIAYFIKRMKKKKAK